MTKKESLRLCIQLWEWLANNPTECKYGKAKELTGQEMRNGCPACHYTWLTAGHIDCGICPVDKWREGESCSYTEYEQWVNEGHKLHNKKENQASAIAQKIADLARASLDRLMENEEEAKREGEEAIQHLIEAETK